MLNSKKDLYLRSLKYRYADEYEKELEVIQRSLEVDANDPYMRERKKWHDLPQFEKYVPRKSIFLSKDSTQIPQQETLDNLCFVTCASSGNYEWCIECLESLQNTSLYKNTPIIIVDLGFTDDQKHYLFENFPIRRFSAPIVNLLADFSYDDVKVLANHQNIFFDQHCEDFAYICHIEPDTWIQDERGIDQLLCLCEKQDFAWVRSPDQEGGAWGWFYHVSLFALKKGSAFYDEWRNQYLLELQKFSSLKRIAPYALNEQILEHIYGQRLTFLEGSHNLPISHVGIPTLSPNDPDQLLHFPKTQEIATSIHIQGSCPYIRKSNERYVYTRCFDIGPSREELAEHVRKSSLCTAQGHNLYDPEIYNEKISLRFRVWPWADKEEIKKLLAQETNR